MDLTKLVTYIVNEDVFIPGTSAVTGVVFTIPGCM